ncbi:hypothetical protein [Glaciecola punicea]|jgi:hypothetical protein|uniref:hypothetical protein n=1 Tax=Glaciecola punicea TaxID=56804 RepID=UPI00068CE99D|nr:hypothetical protein [Glaciecola punicea]
MPKAVPNTAKHTTILIGGISQLLAKQKQLIRRDYKSYSQDLMNNLFSHPYTKVAFVEKDLNVSGATATRYLEALSKGGVLEKHKLGCQISLFRVSGSNELYGVWLSYDFTRVTLGVGYNRNDRRITCRKETSQVSSNRSPPIEIGS